MLDSSASMPQKALALTEEEAFALLEMCALTLAIEGPTHHLVLSRLGSLCREWLQIQPSKTEGLQDDYQDLAPASSPGELLPLACSC